MWQSHGERFRNAKFNPISPGESFGRRTRRPPLRPPGAESLNWLVACMLSRMLNCRLSSHPPEVSLTTGIILVSSQKFSKQNPEHRESQATVSFCDLFRLGLESGRFWADVKPKQHEIA
jgi:hypothetical protein